MTIPDGRWAMAAHRLSIGAVAVPPPPAIPIPEVLNAVIASVYDGDTIYVNTHLTGHTYVENQSIRLLGCNAAELKTPGGDAAAANLEALLPVGTEVVLSQIGSDKYAPRWDSAVAFALAGVPTDLVSLLATQQWVAPWDGRGKKPVPPWPRTLAFQSVTEHLNESLRYISARYGEGPLIIDETHIFRAYLDDNGAP